MFCLNISRSIYLFILFLGTLPGQLAIKTNPYSSKHSKYCINVIIVPILALKLSPITWPTDPEFHYSQWYQRTQFTWTPTIFSGLKQQLPQNSSKMVIFPPIHLIVSDDGNVFWLRPGDMFREWLRSSMSAFPVPWAFELIAFPIVCQGCSSILN